MLSHQLHTTAYTYTHCYTTLLSTGPLLNKSIAKLGPQVPYYIAMYTKRISSSNSSSSELSCRDKCGFETATTYISPQHGALDWLLVPSFLYSYAIEDPLVDSKFLNFQENDALLLLTTGYVLYDHYTAYCLCFCGCLYAIVLAKRGAIVLSIVHLHVRSLLRHATCDCVANVCQLSVLFLSGCVCLCMC
jgi:hypothetical protein